MEDEEELEFKKYTLKQDLMRYFKWIRYNAIFDTPGWQERTPYIVFEYNKRIG